MSGPQLPRGPISAEELARLKAEMLRNDPKYRAQVEAAEAERRERARALREAEQPVLEDLRRVGVDVGSVWDLVNTSEPYPDALPVLLEHLERGGYPDRVLESLGRALAVKPAHLYWDKLHELYLGAAGSGESEGLAVALAASATADDLDAMVGLLGEESCGDSRIHFLRPILRIGGDRGREVVESLRSDPLYGREASALLKRRTRRG